MKIGRHAIVPATLLALSVPATLASAAIAQGAAQGDSGLDARGHLRAVVAPSTRGFAYKRLGAGVQVRVGQVVKNLIFYGPATLRVNANLGENYWTAPSLAVIAKPQPVAFTLVETADALTLQSEKLRVEISKTNGALRFFDPAGQLYTEETAAEPQTLKKLTISNAPTLEVRNSFTLRPDEAVYGLGFNGEDTSNRRGKDLLLVQTNVGIIIPVLMSSRRYGVLWDTYSQMRFKDDAGGASMWAESAPGGVDYYFMAGDTPDAVVADYRALTGQAPMYPKQAFGLFMSKERYKTQAQLLDVAHAFRKDGFPLDYIVQDWQYWGSDKDGSWSGMTWDPTRYPDPAGMARQVHDLHMKLMVSIWPSIGNDTALAHELDAHGLRFEPLHWISKHARVYDAYSPLGRQIYFKYIKSGLLDQGVDALWMDGTEIEVSSAMWNAQDNIRDTKALGRNALGDFTRYLNPYSLLTTQGTYDGERATSDKRVFTLTRSAWAGAQRTAAASWSGDIFASWKTLKQQVADGINVTVTGNPYWTQDTGGFFVADFPGGEKNAAWRELYARWLQFSAFNPIMRIHGTNVEREPYLFRTIDPAVYASLLKSTRLRYRMLPYIYSLSWKVTADSYTLMRPLMMDFPDDRATDTINDSFMFGPSFLVHPVTRAMYNILPPPAATIPVDYLHTPDGQPGLAGQYFEGENFETPKSRFVDLKVDHTWPDPPLAEVPAGLRNLQHFSAKWDGTITAPEDGEYEIGVEGNDGFRLRLDDKIVVEDWAAGAARHKGATVTLRKGQTVRVGIDYYQVDGNRVLRLAWRLPSERQALGGAKAALDERMTTYLPAGSGWFDFWTNQRFDGGRRVTRKTPLDLLPLYVRAGSIVPLGPNVQYATQDPGAPYEVRIYPGANARFTLYEDDNETYAYEKGARATYDLVWNDAARTLTIGARQGRFPGMTPTRQLNLILVKNRSKGGMDMLPATRRISYSGTATTVRF
ncbi:TIM-barrel domain-containing protein [Sphingomonas sp. ASY06-1R]|uniref:glycoside hydrolase family 31 protein n=1 Tax=Sphingomonas sp. ASY06-1R TaxID=3445771 RepID=UPI003FA1EADA